jgi:MFS family permease
MLLMALPAGMLADLLERRHVVIGALSFLGVVAALMGALALTGHITPLGVIALTFVFGLGATTITPALQATLPDLVPPPTLTSAVTLNAMAVSSARAIGPAIAGSVISLLGVGWTFLLNALAFATITVALLATTGIRSRSDRRHVPGEGLRALREGMHFARRDREFRTLLERSFVLAFCVSALLALLPVIVAKTHAGDAGALGLLLSAFGFGSLVGALSLTALTRRLSRSSVILAASVVHGIALVVVACLINELALVLAMFAAGASWTAMTTSINVSAQLLLPASLRARGLSISLMCLMGSLAAGSAVWGQTAQHVGAPTAMLVAGALGIAISMLYAVRTAGATPTRERR